MARPLRFESAEGVYHVLNRGNYRTHIFRSAGAKSAFLKCLAETCARTAWVVHAWCIMSNHFHFAVSTPRANLVDGMRWMQGTFAIRFNGLRQERGHIFQGRYKSLVVDPDEGLGPLCHYIHLNPVRANLCLMSALSEYAWSSFRWLSRPALRPAWYDPWPALQHAGSLADSNAGRQRYRDYLAWLAESKPAQQAQNFETMSRGWIIGSAKFAMELVLEREEFKARRPRLAAELQAANDAIWHDQLRATLDILGKSPAALLRDPKFANWKLAVAALLKERTTVTNRWLQANLHMGSRSDIGRRVVAWLRKPDADLVHRLQITPHPAA